MRFAPARKQFPPRSLPPPSEALSLETSQPALLDSLALLICHMSAPLRDLRADVRDGTRLFFFHVLFVLFLSAARRRVVASPFPVPMRQRRSAVIALSPVPNSANAPFLLLLLLLLCATCGLLCVRSRTCPPKKQKNLQLCISRDLTRQFRKKARALRRSSLEVALPACPSCKSLQEPFSLYKPLAKLLAPEGASLRTASLVASSSDDDGAKLFR